VENSEKLARYAAHHRPFYERLLAQRLEILSRAEPQARGGPVPGFPSAAHAVP
jgi:hypothetical protein